MTKSRFTAPVLLAWAAGLTALPAMTTLPAAAQSLPSAAGLAAMEQRLSPAQRQKAEALVQKAESGNFTAAQHARLRELQSKPGAGAARAQAEQALAARKTAQPSGSVKAEPGPGLRLSSPGQNGVVSPGGSTAGNSTAGNPGHAGNPGKWTVPAEWAAKGR